MKKNKKKINFW